MSRKLLICLALILIIPGLLLTVSCAQKDLQVDFSKAEQERLAMDKDTERGFAGKQEILKAKESVASDRFLNEDIYFDYDKFILKKEFFSVLERKAEWLLNNPGVSVTIEGHCDERGTNAYNIALGNRRAESVKMFMIDLGIDPNRLKNNKLWRGTTC